MLTTLTDDVRAEVALAWLEAPDVARLEIEEDEEPTESPIPGGQCQQGAT